MNILLVNHYAGTPTLGMEYRPYYLAREWVRLGHRVMIVAAAYSHYRARQPAPGDEIVDGIHYRWLPTPMYSGNGWARMRNVLSFLSQLWTQAPALAADFQPDVVISSSTYPMDTWVARRIAQLAGARLAILPVGVDANVSASNLQVGAMRRLLRTLRDRFDIIIVDAGPVTASVEAIPVAASCDGAMLVLRRGRSRSRLAESVAEIRSAGAEYLGLVLNDAEQGDCMRYGSISRMSTEVASALEKGGNVATKRHPLLGAGRVVPANGYGPTKGAA